MVFSAGAHTHFTANLEPMCSDHTILKDVAAVFERVQGVMPRPMGVFRCLMTNAINRI